MFLGNLPQIESDDIIEMGDEVALYDIVTCERVGSRNSVIRFVKPKDYADIST
ncbi:hypothetical protein OAC89_06475 [Deltaproteobacteria bacterium]|nr:hypothetical protein [Deltaproteobacteria bacterium]